MQLELREAIEKARTAALAANCTVTEIGICLDELKAAGLAWTRKCLIVDSQIEHLWRLIERLETVAQAWQTQLGIIADLDRLDVGLKKLNAAILKEEADKKRDPWETVA